MIDWLSGAEWQAVRLSLRVACASVASATPLAVVAAVMLTRERFHGRFVLDAIVHLPLVVPPVVVGWALLLAFGLRGPFGAMLHHAFGLRLVFTTAGAVLATSVMIFPLIVRAVRLSIEWLDDDLVAAARTLGAGPWMCFVKIILPLIAPGILSGAITGFAAGLGEFGAVISFASDIPGQTETLPLAIYAATQVPRGEATAGKLATVSIALAAFGLLLADLLSRWLRRRLGRTA